MLFLREYTNNAGFNELMAVSSTWLANEAIAHTALPASKARNAA